MRKSMFCIAALCLTMAACSPSGKDARGSGDTTSGNHPETIADSDSIRGIEAKDTVPAITEEETALLNKIAQLVNEKNVRLGDLHVTDKHDSEYERLELSYEERFIRLFSDNPKTLDLPGKEIEKIWAEGFRVVTSPDGKFRAYSWPTYRCGSMVNFCGFMQFRNPSGKTYVTWESKRKPEEDLLEYEDAGDNDGAYKGWEWKTVVDKIYQMETAGGRVYLTLEYCTSGQSSGWQIVSAYAITGNTLTSMPIFLENGKRRSTMMFETYHEDVASHDFITYNEKDRSLSIQQYEDKENNLIVTRNTKKAKDKIVYRYDGKMFKKVK